MSRRTRTILGLLLLAISPCCLGDTEPVMFQWKFGSGVSSSLTECANYPITVQSSSKNASAIGTPPYFMMAFLPSGIPTRSPIGSDLSNLSWTVDQPTGSPLMLSVVDAHGDFGGQPSIFMTVVAGTSSSCLPSPPAKTITITTNFTSPITTCQPLGFNITGGKKPYNLTLSALNSPVLTSLTLGAEDDIFTYINRADPGTQLMASVSDADGVWAPSTQLFQTSGSTNATCAGLVTSSSKSPPLPKHHSSAAVPIAASLVVALLLLAAALGYFWRRRRNARRYREAGAAILPDAWVGPFAIPGSGPAEDLALNTHDDSARSGQNSKRAAVASARYRDANDSLSSRPLLPSGEQPVAEDSPDIVIQHRDGGRVQEIPPPYFDHDSIDGPSNSGSRSAERLTPKERTSRRVR